MTRPIVADSRLADIIEEHLLTGASIADCAGRGTGLDDAGLERKRELLAHAVARAKLPADADALAVLAEFGGFEIEALVGAGIPFQVVPGITAAAGASCYAGIPLTHRDHAQSVTFVTGHRRAGQVELDWPRLTSDKETVVVYMGVRVAPAICQQLIIHGRAPETPAAIIERATTDKQRTIIGSLGSLPRLMENQSIKPPALIIIGSVVSLHEKLEWRA